jgi:hypothetical protein
MFLAKPFLATGAVVAAMLASPPAAAEPNRIPELPPCAAAVAVATAPRPVSARGRAIRSRAGVDDLDSAGRKPAFSFERQANVDAEGRRQLHPAADEHRYDDRAIRQPS